MQPETRALNEKLVISALANLNAWEEWTEKVTKGPGKTLNLSLIRLSKGLVKAWRTFLIEQGQS